MPDAPRPSSGRTLDPIRLAARSLDGRAAVALQPGARFVVHSVFASALNLRAPDGLLLSLLGPAGGNGPATVVLAAAPPSGLAAGQPAVVEPSGELAIGGRLVVELGSAPRWQPLTVELPLVAARVRRNVELAERLAYAARGADGLGGLLPHLAALAAGASPPPLAQALLRVAGAGLAALLAAWQADDARATAEAAERLVGLGPGQTPSGDDLLAGFFVARLRTRPDDRRSGPLAAACLERARGRTTDLGLARLGFAAEGDLDERSLAALAALASGRPERVEGAVRALLGYGHSSGLDTLVGLLVGLRLDLPAAQPEGDPPR